MDIIPRRGATPQASPTAQSAEPKRHLSMDGVRRPRNSAPVLPQAPVSAPTQPSAPTPQSSRAAAPKLQLATSRPHPIRPIAAPKPGHQASSRTPAPQPDNTQIATKPAEKPEAEVERPSLWRRLQTPLFIIGGSLAGFGMQSLTIGLVLLAIYAVVAWLTKIYSRTSFALALVALIAVPVVIVFRNNTEVAGNFATYTFVLIVIAIVSLIRENPGTSSRYIHNRKRS